MLAQAWTWLNGKKTYIVAAVTVAYAAAEYWNGQISQQAAIGMILGAGGLGGLRHGLSSTLARTLVGIAVEATKKTAPLLALAFGVVLALSACTTLPTSNSSSASIADPLIKELAAINAAGIGDLQGVENIASVPNAGLPGGIEDQDGLRCAQAGVVVLEQIQTVNAAGNKAGAGVLTLGEMASLFQPGSAPYDQAMNTLTTGCVAKANDVLGAAGVIAAGGVVGALVSTSNILPLVAALPK